MPTPTHIDREQAALALLRERANPRRAEAILELITWQAVPLTAAEIDILNALLAIGQAARSVEA